METQKQVSQQSPRLIAGIDQVRTQTDTVEFNQGCYQKKLQRPLTSMSTLLDITMALRLRPSHDPLIYPSQVHLFIKTDTHVFDITPQVLEELRELLNSLSPATLKQQYGDGMASRVRQMKDSPAVSGIDPEQSHAAELLMDKLQLTSPLSSLLDSLGDLHSGYGGALHLSTFLYDDIDIPAISLGNVLKRSANDTLAKTDLSSLKSLNLIVCYGSVSPVDPLWRRTPYVAGSIDVSTEWFFSNELLPEFNDLEHKIKARILDINTKLGAGGDIQQAIATVADQLQTIREAASAIASVDSDIVKQIGSLQRQTDALDKKLVSKL